MKKTLKGFTLIEMLIVIVIIGILAAVLLPKIGGARDKANDVAIKANVRNLAQGVLQMQLAGESLPSSFADLNTTGNAQKYDFNEIKQDTGFYSYTGDGRHFIICGELTDEGGNNNTGADHISGKISDWTESSTGKYFCYKG